jgi:hypothetical protein
MLAIGAGWLFFPVHQKLRENMLHLSYQLPYPSRFTLPTPDRQSERQPYFFVVLTRKAR